MPGTRPPDILITTPESLFLLLTSRARDALRSVDTVIIDEVHALAGSKRGAHLALSLERLDALSPGLLLAGQRIGLSATVRPAETVASFLGGARPVTIAAPPSSKELDLQIVVPVEDMTDLDPPPGAEDAADGPAQRRSIWPHVEERVLDLIEQHRSTIVFANYAGRAEPAPGSTNWPPSAPSCGPGHRPVRPRPAGPRPAGTPATGLAAARRGGAPGPDHGAGREHQRGAA